MNLWIIYESAGDLMICKVGPSSCPTAGDLIWLVGSTPLKSMSQLGILVSWDDNPQISPICGKMKNVPNYQQDMQ